MCSVRPIIFESLSIISKLGAADTSTRKEHVESTTKKAYSVLGVGSAASHGCNATFDCCTKAAVRAQVLNSVQAMMVSVVDNEEKSIIECGCVAAALLQQLLYHTDSCPASRLAASSQDVVRGTTISVKQRKAAELASRVVLHTAVLACLDEEARLYPKLALVKKKAFIGARVVEVPPQQRHHLLRSCMSIIISVYKHPYYGVGVRNNLTGEVLTAALQLCFAPGHARVPHIWSCLDFPEDCGHFRLQLESAVAAVEPTLSLRHFLLLRGIAASAQKSGWLLKVCTAMSVRRYLLREKQDGVRLIVRAGLDITDGDDWRQCEAVASLVARARVQDVEAFYRVIGPQVARILASKECQQLGGSVIRVMSMILSQLMQRSPSLTLEHVAKLLLHPLIELTVNKPSISSSSSDSGQDSSLSSTSQDEAGLSNSSLKLGVSGGITTEDIISAQHNRTAITKSDQKTSDFVNTQQTLKDAPVNENINTSESEHCENRDGALSNDASDSIPNTTDCSSDVPITCPMNEADSTCEADNSCTTENSCAADNDSTTENSCEAVNNSVTENSCAADNCTTENSCEAVNNSMMENSCAADNECTTENSCAADNECTTENSCAADGSCTTENSCAADNNCTTENSCAADGNCTTDSSGISSASGSCIAADSVSPVTSCSRSSSVHVCEDCNASVSGTSDSEAELEERERRKGDKKGHKDKDRVWEEGGVGLDRCVEALDRIIVRAGGGEGCSAVLTPALCPLFAIAAVPRPCRTARPAVACIVKYLSNTSNSKCVEKLLVMAGLCYCKKSPPVRDGVHLAIGPDGGVDILPEDHDEDVSLAKKHKDWFKKDQNVADAIAHILQQLKNAAVVRKFFCELPKFLTFNSKTKKVKKPNTLLTVEDEILEELWELRKVVLVSELYGRLVEEVNLLDSVFLSVSDAVPMILSLLRASAEPCDEDLESLQASVLLHVILMLCHFVCDPNQALCLTSSDWRDLQNLLPVLKKLRGTRNEEAVREFIQQVENAITTRGVVMKPLNQRRAKEAREKLMRNTTASVKITTKEAPLIQEICSKDEEKTSCSNSSAVKRYKGDLKSRNLNVTYEPSEEDIDEDEVLDDRLKSVYNPNATDESCSALSVVSSSSSLSSPFMSVNTKKTTLNHDYDIAMEDVYSPLVPVLGHALISLSKLVEAGDAKAKANEKKLLTLFEHNLKHDDSYVYLAAVEGLAVLCDAFPDEIVPVICDQISSNRSAVDRVKMTEVATRAARRLSTALVAYKQHFLNALIGGVRDQDAMVRAACLSSLGELCKELRLCMGPERVEVLSVAVCVMKCDDDVEPRRSALLLVTLLLRGLGMDTICVLKDVLKDLCKCLKLVATQDKDEVTRTHALVAMEELNSITRAFMIPKLNNTKTIYVTEPPPKLV